MFQKNNEDAIFFRANFLYVNDRNQDAEDILNKCSFQYSLDSINGKNEILKKIKAESSIHNSETQSKTRASREESLEISLLPPELPPDELRVHKKIKLEDLIHKKKEKDIKSKEADNWLPRDSVLPEREKVLTGKFNTFDLTSVNPTSFTSQTNLTRELEQKKRLFVKRE